MSERIVNACDFCRQEVDCSQIPLAGRAEFDVCKSCFDAKELGPLMKAAREAKEAEEKKNRPNNWWLQQSGYAGPGQYGG